VYIRNENGDEIEKITMIRRTNMNKNEKTENSISLKEDVQFPPLYKVILENDDFINTFSRVIKMIMVIFNYDQNTATEITYEAHSKGQAVVGRWDREKCVTYVAQLRNAGIGAHMEQD